MNGVVLCVDMEPRCSSALSSILPDNQNFSTLLTISEYYEVYNYRGNEEENLLNNLMKKLI